MDDAGRPRGGPGRHDRAFMTATEGAILGIVQGLTEFLPVSSKGHLALAGALLGVEDQDLVFKVAVHFGTLGSLLVFFREEVVRILRAFFGGLLDPRRAFSKDPQFRMAIWVALACVPAGLAGVLFEDTIERWLDSPLSTCYGLLFTAVLLLSTKLALLRPESELSTGQALWIGCMQVLALLPGVSRSGTTISAGLWGGLPGPVAGRFSFLLSMPLILGATLLEARKLDAVPVGAWPAMVAGVVCSFATGVLALSLLLAVLRARRFSWFGAYCAIVGGVGAFLLHTRP